MEVATKRLPFAGAADIPLAVPLLDLVAGWSDNFQAILAVVLQHYAAIPDPMHRNATQRDITFVMTTVHDKLTRINTPSPILRKTRPRAAKKQKINN